MMYIICVYIRTYVAAISHTVECIRNDVSIKPFANHAKLCREDKTGPVGKFSIF